MPCIFIYYIGLFLLVLSFVFAVHTNPSQTPIGVQFNWTAGNANAMVSDNVSKCELTYFDWLLFAICQYLYTRLLENNHVQLFHWKQDLPLGVYGRCKSVEFVENWPFWCFDKLAAQSASEQMEKNARSILFWQSFDSFGLIKGTGPG